MRTPVSRRGWPFAGPPRHQQDDAPSNSRARNGARGSRAGGLLAAAGHTLTVAALLLAVPATACSRRPTDHRRPGEATAASEIDALLTALERERSFAGTVAVLDRGRVVLHKGYGQADREARRSNDAHTRFQIASLSKLITRTGVLRLVDAGRLSLDDAVADWLAPHPSGERITLRQLVEHTSGLPDLHNEDREFMTSASLSVPRTLPTLVARFFNRPLHFPPGSQVRYSNSGYILLARVIERATGLPYAEAVQRLVFGPAGMRESSDGRPPAGAMAVGYTRRAGAIVPAAAGDLSNYRGSGSICATSMDMLAWRQAMRAGGLLRAKPIAAFGNRSHVGHMDGFESALIDVSWLDVAVLVLSNQDDSRASAVASDILTRVLRRRLVPAAERADARWVGRYAGHDPTGAGMALEIRRTDAGLCAVMNGRRSPLLLDPETGALVPTDGRDRVVNVVLRLEPGSSGTDGVVVDESGQEIRLTRIR